MVLSGEHTGFRDIRSRERRGVRATRAYGTLAGRGIGAPTSVMASRSISANNAGSVRLGLAHCQ